MNPKHMMGVAIGGAIVGYVEKKWPNLPTLPMIGRTGTIAIVCYFLGKRGGMASNSIVRDMGIAAASIAGYSLGKEGKVAGEDVEGDDDDVSGAIAAQV